MASSLGDTAYTAESFLTALIDAAFGPRSFPSFAKNWRDGCRPEPEALGRRVAQQRSDLAGDAGELGVGRSLDGHPVWVHGTHATCELGAVGIATVCCRRTGEGRGDERSELGALAAAQPRQRLGPRVLVVIARSQQPVDEPGIRRPQRL